MTHCCNSLKVNHHDSIPLIPLKKEIWFKDYIKTITGFIPVIDTELTKKDIFDGWKVRWDFGRDKYKILPGLYAVGSPDENSDVLVTANYKLTFDKLRKELGELNLWIIVLDTKGINVWCAAGKGAFGTDELIKRINYTKIVDMVSHRRLILPQLGAPGVDSNKLKSETGFSVIYGPVLSSDIKEFIQNNHTKTDKMRTVNFKIMDRMAVIPVEFIQSFKLIGITIIYVLILNIIRFQSLNINFLFDFLPFFASIIAGTIVVPILLPFIPFRSFALKGLIISIINIIIFHLIFRYSYINLLSLFLITGSITSFLSLNFTGATTFTSLSGVKREVNIATPIYIISILCGIVLNILTKFSVI